MCTNVNELLVKTLIITNHIKEFVCNMNINKYIMSLNGK